MNTIEKILNLDHKISLWKLIYSKYDYKWFFLIIITIIFAIFLMSIILISENIILKTLLFLGILLIGFFIVSYVLKKNAYIARKYYKFSISKKEKWSYLIVMKIREKIIKKELKGKIKLNEQNLIFIIESLRKDAELKKYSYSLYINALIILISIYLGAFLGGLGNYAKNLPDFLKSYKYLGLILILSISIIYYIEIIIIKVYILENKKKKYRLTRVFENIYLKKTLHNKKYT